MLNINSFNINNFKIFTIIALILISMIFCSKEKGNKIEATDIKTDIGMVITENTSMRIDPSIYSARISQLKKGETIEIIDKSKEKSWIGKSSNFWYKVKLEKGITGWVYGENIKLFSNGESRKINSYISEFWDKETEKLKKELAGKWWSINQSGNFTNHGLEIMEDGSYKSYYKGGRPIKGEYNFNFNDKEIIFLNGTSFKADLNYSRRGLTYFLEVKSEKKEIRFKKISDTEDSNRVGVKTMNNEEKDQDK